MGTIQQRNIVASCVSHLLNFVRKTGVFFQQNSPKDCPHIFLVVENNCRKLDILFLFHFHSRSLTHWLRVHQQKRLEKQRRRRRRREERRIAGLEIWVCSTYPVHWVHVRLFRDRDSETVCVCVCVCTSSTEIFFPF